MARFISADSIGFEAGPNLYPYVNNDPMDWVDPYGLQRCANGDCDFSPEVAKASVALATCFGRSYIITCGTSGHAPGDPHSDRVAIDIGHGTNPWLTPELMKRCFDGAQSTTDTTATCAAILLRPEPRYGVSNRWSVTGHSSAIESHQVDRTNPRN